MNVRSALLQSLAAPLGGDLSIPEVLFPMAELQYPLQSSTFNTSPSFIGALASFGVSAYVGRTPSQAASDITVCTFDKGTYSINITEKMVADYLQSVTTFPNSGSYLLIPNGVGYMPLQEFAPLIGTQSYYWRDNVTFNQAGWTLHIYSGATAAAQNSGHILSGYIRQLI